ncbi:MAG TPA: dephospho-CoA kinase, partial [Acidimicrobiales bacterium]|nr:dephospho-CoA kinase [Acidimicrobiales bacterium]
MSAKELFQETLEIGLTGGIGSGKSTVSAGLVERGAVLIDADAIVRELQQPGKPVFEKMVERWGEKILSEEGELNRQAVADIVFKD